MNHTFGDHEVSSVSSASRYGENENPFRIPTDEEVFMMRDEEKRRKKEERRRLSSVPVHEKSTWSTRLNVKRHNDRALDKQLRDTNSMIHSNLNGRKHTSKLQKNAQFPPIQREQREKENMSQFIEKKRQMFLIQMSLDTKKQEIKKLEKKAEERERKLRLEEEALKRDAQRFDNFLTNNDIQAVQAIQRAEEETKSKQGKQNEIKKLNARKAAIKNDISKLKDQLSKCMTYKNFLESLTPSSWFKEAKSTEEKVDARKLTNPSKKKEKNSSQPSSARAALHSNLIMDRRDEDSVESDEQENADMFFQRPEQLLAKFTALEEENLFLIQSSQEIDEQLDELKKQERESREKMDKQAENLRKQIESLDLQIQEETEQRQVIQKRLTSSNDRDSGEKLKTLNRRIAEIFEACCDASTMTDDPDPIFMLTQIESKLESLLSEMGDLKDDFVMKHERNRDKERRKQSRDAKNNMVQHAPTRKPKEPKEPIKQRQGKPLMKRSQPVDKKKLQDESKKAEQEDQMKRDEFKELFDGR